MLEDNIKLAVKYGMVLGTIAGVREKSRGQDKEQPKKITKQQPVGVAQVQERQHHHHKQPPINWMLQVTQNKESLTAASHTAYAKFFGQDKLVEKTNLPVNSLSSSEEEEKAGYEKENTSME